MLDTVISINPNEEVSIKADKQIFQLYASATEKNGRLIAFNELKAFSKQLREEREKALEEVSKSEKWFRKGIDFLNEWQRPYRVGEVSDEDKKRIQELAKSYPDLALDKFWENYEMRGSYDLLNMLVYINNNEFFERVDSINISKTAAELYDAILQVDYLHVMHERTNDLIHLIIQNGFESDFEGKEFIRTPDDIKEQNEKRKPGPKTPNELLNDIDSILEEVMNKHEFLANDGSLNISKTIKDYAYKHPMFAKKWVDEETAEKGGYSERRLHALFSQQYKEMKS